MSPTRFLLFWVNSILVILLVSLTGGGEVRNSFNCIANWSTFSRKTCGYSMPFFLASFQSVLLPLNILNIVTLGIDCFYIIYRFHFSPHFPLLHSRKSWYWSQMKDLIFPNVALFSLMWIFFFTLSAMFTFCFTCLPFNLILLFFSPHLILSLLLYFCLSFSWEILSSSILLRMQNFSKNLFLFTGIF